jgi:hypothetical protein
MTAGSEDGMIKTQEAIDRRRLRSSRGQRRRRVCHLPGGDSPPDKQAKPVRCRSSKGTTEERGSFEVVERRGDDE